MIRYGLIGKRLTHSFSKRFFQHKFKAENLVDHQYDLFELKSISEVNELMQLDSLHGFNITIPYKEEIIPYLDRLSDDAKEIGAVNCVKKTNHGWVGFNTDVYGFRESFKRFANNQVRQVYILGNGGSAKAVKQGLKQLNLKYSVVSRTGELNYQLLTPSHIRNVDAILNTTPLGMSPSFNEWPEIPYEAISNQHFAFDLIYNPEETVFLKRARLAGAQTKNGMEMLELQAIKSWQIWKDNEF